MTTMANSESVSSSYLCLWEAQGESLLWNVLVVHKDITSHVPKVDLIQEGVLNLLATCWSLLLVLQTSFKYLVPKLPLSVRNICPAVPAGQSVPERREGLCSFCQGTAMAVY